MRLEEWIFSMNIIRKINITYKLDGVIPDRQIKIIDHDVGIGRQFRAFNSLYL